MLCIIYDVMADIISRSENLLQLINAIQIHIIQPVGKSINHRHPACFKFNEGISEILWEEPLVRKSTYYISDWQMQQPGQTNKQNNLNNKPKPLDQLSPMLT